MVLVVVKALDILEWVARDSDRTYSLTEIADGLAMNQATCVNILQTLVSRNYIEHLGRKKGYRLGPASFKLTKEGAYGQNVVSASQDIMEALTAGLSESCVLGILRNNKRYTLLSVNSEQDVQVQVHSERNAYDTASGRLLLAYLSPHELKKFIDQNGLPTEMMWPDAATPALFAERLEAIRRERIVFTDHKDRHVKGFAVPISAKGSVVAGLSVFFAGVSLYTRKAG